jgi:excisionase family DNA binding protein
MNTLTFPLSVALETHARRSVPADPYASEAQTTALLRSGAAYRRERIQAADMITTDEAAELAGATRVTINAWIKAGRCIGVAHLRRGYKLPRWQFEPFVFPHLQPLSQALGSQDGWQLLAFLESPHPALDGQTPRVALEQGMDANRVLGLATAEGH